MNLMYCSMNGGNFGDDLNIWYWDRLRPGIIDGQGLDTLIGIGTLLQAYHCDPLPAAGLKYVLGAGAGSKGRLPSVDGTWRIMGVRGPLTASYLGLSDADICGDPAIMTGEFPELYHSGARGGVGFMPHVWSLDDWDWQKTCDDIGLVYIDPQADSKETIRKISSLDKLITEAMHGAIVADSMRIPWHAVAISNRFESSKWCDWAGALGVDLHFHQLPQLHRQPKSFRERFRRWAKEHALKYGATVNYLDPQASSQTRIELAKRQLADLSRSTSAQLSDDGRLRKLQSRFQEKFDQFCDLQSR